MPSFTEEIAAQFAAVTHNRDEMHGYQDEGYVFMKANPFSGLFVDMGLGKTVTAGTVACDLLMDFETEKVLIIGPPKVATTTWPDELRNWSHLAPFSFTVIREDDDDPRLAKAAKAARQQARIVAAEWEMSTKDAAKYAQFQAQRAETAMRHTIRAENARSSASIHICPNNHVEWLVNFHKRGWPYRTVIIDESCAFKDHQSGRFKALKKVRSTPGLIERLHILTATPATETYEDLFAQIYLLDGGERFGKSITKFRERYFIYNRWSMKWKLRPGAEEEILEKIADICLVMKKEDYLPTEEPLIVQRAVRLSEKQMALYKEMEDEFVVQLDDGTEVEAETAAALMAKLLQMASGVLYETYRLEDVETGDMTKVRKVHHLHDHKIDTLREIVEEAQGNTLLVAYHHRSSLDRLKKAFPKAVVMDRQGKCVKDWNAGKIQMLLIHPASGGHGLNLQAGGHNIVFFDLPWSGRLYMQLIGRLARQGQKHPVVVQILVAIGTKDADVWAALREKNDVQALFFSILKSMIHRFKRRTVLH